MHTDPAGPQGGLLPWLVVFLACLSHAESAQTDIRIVDAQTGKTTPAMVSIVSLTDGVLRLPPDGRPYRGQGSLVPVMLRGVSFDPDPSWPGPVRKMRGQGDNRNRSHVYGRRPSLPYWEEEFMYLTSGDFSIRLEPGRYRIAVEHGNEYVPLVATIEIVGEETIRKTFVLTRWVHMPDQGWYSGDVHVHHPTLTAPHRAFLLHYARAEDIHVLNTLEQGTRKRRRKMLSGYGRSFRARHGTFCLVPGQEDPSGSFGHILGLDIRAPVRDPDRYDLYDGAFRGIHGQGGIVGYAHFAWNGCGLPRGFPWYVTSGGVDLVEILQFASLNALDYHDYLNLGFRLTAVAGSDFPWGSTIGEVRTYVYTGSRFDVDRWFEGLRQGRTFVTNGPVMELRVDDMPPGAVLHRQKGQQIDVAVSAKGHPAIGRPCDLRVMGPAGIVRQVTVTDEPRDSLEARFSMPVTRSIWLLASTSCPNGAVAHTSPVYVIVDDQPCYDPVRGPAIADRLIASIRALEKELEEQYGRDDTMLSNVRDRMHHAVDFYETLKERMTP